MTNLNLIFGSLDSFSQFSDYREFRNDFLKRRENQELYDNESGSGRIHGDGNDPELWNPTIGYGFNLKSRTLSNITAYLTHAFGTISPVQEDALSILGYWKGSIPVMIDGISRALNAEDIVRGARGLIPELSALTSLEMTEMQATALLNAVLDGIPDTSFGSVEAGLDNALDGQWLQNSKERVALISMYFQSPGLIGDGIKSALADNNRAEAWYQIRYGHANYNDLGLQTRKNFESDLFRLTTTSSVNEAEEALSHLYTQRYYTIDQRDAYSSFDAAISSLKTAVQNAYTQQSPVDWVMAGDGADDWLNVDSNSSMGALVRSGDGRDTIYGGVGSDYLYGGAHSDSIDGGLGSDRINGGGGADKLYAGGNQHEDGVTDYLYGAEGFDSYFVSHGDQISDSDGLGEVFFRQKLYGGIRHQADAPGTYTSSGNHFTYILSGSDLYVHYNYDNSTILIRNFQKSANSLGIVLEDVAEETSSGGGSSGSGGSGTSPFSPTSFANTLKSALQSAGQIANTPPPQSPLVFDLNNDGITLKTQAESNAIFDLDGDGFATHISYIGSDDGFLALDVNSDGIINDVTELFGFPFTNGFNKLAQHDGNSDGKIDASDAIFNDLLVFRDINGDGVSQSNELTPLSLNNIASMSLTNTALSQSGEAYVAFQGTYTLANGETRELSDVMLTSDALHSRYVGNVTINPATENLPNIKGYGLLPDLNIAMSLNPALLTVVSNLVATMTAGDFTAMNTSFQGALLTWADVASITLNELDSQRGNNLTVDESARTVKFENADVTFSYEQLGLMKKFAGLDGLELGDGNNGNPDFVTTGMKYLDAYNLLVNNLFAKFIVGAGVLTSQLPHLRYDADTDNLYTVDPSVPAGTDLVAQVMDIVNPLIYQGANELVGTKRNDTIHGYGGNDTITDVVGGNDVIHAGEGDDLITIERGNDTVYAGAGNDTLRYSAYATANGSSTTIRLEGGEGDDSILQNMGSVYYNTYITHVGGPGNDTFVSSISSDTYVFNRGDGRDLIEDRIGAGLAAGGDSVSFGPGIESSHLKVSNNGTDIVIDILDPANLAANDRITVKNAYTDSLYSIELYQFADGSGITAVQMKALAAVIHGSSGADSMTGTTQNDVIHSYEGNDTITDLLGGIDVIYAGEGDDVITIERGNDTVYGGAGNDTLRYSTYSGEYPTIRLEGGDGDDSFALRGGGTVSYNTSITHVGGAGNDTFTTSFNGDTYLFNRGDGSDLIEDNGSGGAADYVSFGAGILASHLKVSNNGTDIVIDILDPANPAANDRITVKKAFTDSLYQIELYQFTEGGNISAAQMKTLASVVHGSSGADSMTGTIQNDVIHSYEGNDTITDLLGGVDVIYAGEGDDVITIERGNDTVYGGAGNDTLRYSTYSGEYPTIRLEGGDGDDSFALRGGGTVSYNTSITHVGGAGNDTFITSFNGDTYLFNRGDGSDLIEDKISTGGNYASDYVSFGAGILASHLKVSNNGTDIVIDILDPANPAANDRITVKNAYTDSLYSIELYQFADGSGITAVQMKTLAAVIHGSSGADSMTGTTQDDVIHGYGGNDTIADLQAGHDVIHAGEGDDLITIERGNDTVYAGTGNDTIRYSAYASGTSTTIRLEGGEGDDSFAVRSGGSVYYDTYITHVGGPGNDTFVNSVSSDTYVFNRGDGSDLIEDKISTGGNYGPDYMSFGPGIQSSHLKVSNNGTDIVIDILDPANPAANDRITVKNAYTDSLYSIELYLFADGSGITAAQMKTLAAVVHGSSAADNMTGTTQDDVIHSYGGNDTITDITGGNDVIHAGEGDDLITIERGNDTVYAGTGNDTLRYSRYSGDSSATIRLEGGEGIDSFAMRAGGYVTHDTYITYVGGAGNDTFVNSVSSDTYVFNRGDGSDLIEDRSGANGAAGADYMSFGPGIQTSHLKVSNNGTDIVIDILDPANPAANDRITVKNAYTDSLYAIELYLFADGSGITAAQMKTLAAVVHGSSAADNMTGTTQDDVIHSYGGNDTITDITGGNDVIHAGEGDDLITIERGNDTVYAGMGNDTLHYSTYSSDSPTLRLEGGEGDDSFAVRSGGFVNSNTSITHVGGAGNDTFVNSVSSDTYLFNRGDGSDLIEDWRGVSGAAAADFVSFGAGIQTSHLKVSNNGTDIVIDILDPANPAANDRITVKNAYTDSLYAIELYMFANGSATSAAPMLAAAQGVQGTSSNDVLIGSSLGEVLDGNAGDDFLAGGAGTDTLTGGSGHDIFLFSGDYLTTDTITDFSAMEDVIQIKKDTFLSFTLLGSLSSDHFVSGSGTAQALDADDYLIYDTASGSLYYDADGSGSTAMQLIAVLATSPSLSYSHFSVV